MLAMFFDASVFNGDVSTWDVSSVTNMQEMFWRASAFNQDVSGWDVSNVTNMQAMFYDASVFNHSLCDWASKSPQLGVAIVMFAGASSCVTQATPVLNNGTPGDPHDGPFCFIC
eukprot:scaffold79426_cov35-Attheya_sp.AAC.2